MRVRDQQVHPNASFIKSRIAAAIITATSLTDAVVFSYQPDFAYQLTRIRSFCRTKAGAVTAVVKVGTRTAASITFTAATEVAQTLSSTLADLRGTSTEPITIELTTDGTGALTNGQVFLEFRPKASRK